MSLLTEQEMTAFFPFGLSLCASDIRLVRAIESAVIAKIKEQGPSAWAATSDEGVVEALGFNQSKSRFTTPLYLLPEGD